MSADKPIVGVLLAAGRGERFGGDKLLASARTVPTAASSQHDGDSIGVVSCRNLIAVLSDVIAVVRPNDTALAQALVAAGARVVRCDNAHAGMGASLACGVRSAHDAAGWVVALGDMPWIAASTIERVARALREGAVVAAPFFEGQRGHPVGFGASCYAQLATLADDHGAKSVVAAHRSALVRIDVDDAGALRDVDRPADLD